MQPRTTGDGRRRPSRRRHQRRPSRRAAAALVAAAGLFAAGCGTADGPEARQRGEAATLRAEASYGRHAAVRGKVDIRIANHGVDQVEVEAWQVRHPLFEVVPPAERRSFLPPDGVARIVPVPFGDPRCEVTDATGAVVVLTLRDAGGTHDVTVPLADGVTGLSRAHDLACATAAVADAVALELAPGALEGTGDDAVLRTSLVLQRTGAGTVSVVEVRGSILFSVDAPARSPLAELAAGADSAVVPLAVRATRCEAHALTESKTSFTFPVYASLDGGAPALVQVTASGAAREVLQDLLDTTCGPEFLAG